MWLFVRLLLGDLLLGTSGGTFAYREGDDRITRSSKVKATATAPTKLIQLGKMECYPDDVQ